LEPELELERELEREREPEPELEPEREPEMIASIILTAFIYAHAAGNQYNRELEAYVADFLEPVNKTKSYPKRYAEALEMVPIILNYCEYYNVDPLRVAVIMEYESSWRQDAVGKLGEIGPMQLMPRFFKRVFGLKTLDSQIHAGIWWLSVATERCGGDVTQAYNYYGMVTCKPIKKFAKWRARKYHRAVRKYRGEK
jgi:hypothetical protein